MTEWKEYKLGEIVHIIGGGTPKTFEPKYWNGSIPWLSVVDFNNGNKYVYDAEKYITQEGLENSSTRLLKKGDIIISARGTVGAMAMIGREMAFNQSCYGIRNSELVDNHYLFYLLKNSINELKQNSHGGVFDTITRETFNMIEISLPPLPEQIRIASILSSLDDKIDLLHRENKTLEAMAETLFRQWFIEEAKEDWEENPLGKCIKLVGGGTPKTSEERFWNGNVFWLSGGDIANNHKSFVSSSEKSISEDGLNNSSAKLLPENAMVISARGTVGKYCLLSKPMAFSQSNYGILPIYNDCYFFTYLLVAYHIDELQSAAYGSVFDTITTKTFEGVSVLIPKETSYIVEFEKMIEPYFSKMKQNNKQIQTLIQQRDSLLPKLMSGEVKI